MEIEMSCIRKNKKVCQNWAVDFGLRTKILFFLPSLIIFRFTDTQANHLLMLMLRALGAKLCINIPTLYPVSSQKMIVMYLQASSPSPGDWCRGPSVCRLRGGPERWTGREPGGSRGARWGQCMKGGLCIETSSQNRSQTRGGKSIIYVFITSLNLGLLLRVLSRCCYMLSYLRSIDGQLRLLSSDTNRLS